MACDAQYFDPDAADITIDDADWAIATARSGVQGARRVSETGNLSRFDLPAT